MDPKVQREMLRLFDALVFSMEKSSRVKEENVASNLIFELYNMWGSSKSRTLSESAIPLDPEVAEDLLEEGLAQKLQSEDGEKHALTFKGIAQCIKIKHSRSLEEQFLKFLEQADQKFNTTEQTHFLWNEKLATLSLVLLASTSPSSAISLNNEANKLALAEVFQETLDCLKKFKILGQEELRTVSRGESQASALMSRLDTLSRKTNHYYKYVGKGSQYYFEIEKDGDVDNKRLLFLLNRIFEKYDSGCNYRAMYRELARISQLYYPRFLSRSVNSNIILSVLRKLKSYLEEGILDLPHDMKPKL